MANTSPKVIGQDPLIPPALLQSELPAVRTTAPIFTSAHIR